MNKEQFIRAFRKRLKGMPREEIEKTISYYEEMIADKIEGGMSEREAVASLGDIDELACSARGAASDAPAAKPSRTRPAPWVIVLLVLGSPLWIGLAVGAFGILIGFMATAFALFVSFVATMAGFLVGGVAEVAKAVFLIGTGGWQILISLGAGIMLVGIGILMILAVKSVERGLWKVVMLPFVGLKRMFERR
ncbi:MAG: DUF1700 domain-containing protein [Clostridia bacterium]|nr:DUF1700 domain-containing protein [Clostridia bacterium]